MIVSNLFKAFAKAVIDFLFPDNLVCYFCGEELPPKAEEPICSVCNQEFEFLEEHLCRKCGRSITEAHDQYEPYAFKCKECQEQFHFFDKHRSYTVYDGKIIEALMGLKYKRQVYHGVFLGKKLAQLIRSDVELQNFDFVVPVPAHYMRQLKRGYNQSEILADQMCRDLDVRRSVKMIKRIRSTKKLKNLGRESRKMMLKSVFVVKSEWKERIKGKTVMLVDDIYTTGATLNACSQALYEAGADKIVCVTVARGR